MHAVQPSGKGANPGPPRGGQESLFKTKKQRNSIRALGPHPQEGEPLCSENQKDFRMVKSLEFLYELCKIEGNLLKLFDKLNDSQYMNGIVNLSSHTLTNAEISVLSKGLGFTPPQGNQTLAI